MGHLSPVGELKVRLKLSAFKQTRWYEYLIRFVFGGLVTAATGLIAQKYGPVVGGLFLAFPSIFPASVTLVQTHKEKQEKKEGKGKQLRQRMARQAAGVTSAGAAIGSVGLFCFAVVIWQMSGRLPPWLVLALALAIWLGVNVFVWWARRKILS